MWTLIYDEEIPIGSAMPASCMTTARPAKPFTWLRIWELIVGDGQKLHRSEYSRPA